MTYLITGLIWWLVPTMAFAALAGWAWQGMRAQARDESQARERDRLIQSLVSAVGAAPEIEVSYDTSSIASVRRAELDAARIAELERALEASRALAVIPAPPAGDSGEVVALKARIAELEAERTQAQGIEIVRDEAAEKSARMQEEESAVREWRLRYFERRVQYLESLDRAPQPLAVAPEPASEPAFLTTPLETPAPDRSVYWRARYFEARSRILEEEAHRTVAAPVIEAPAPIIVRDEAAEAQAREREARLAWRVRYLERRAMHALASVHSATPMPEEIAPQEDFEREASLLKWRVRYLEARVRHLETRRPAPLAPRVEAAPAAAASEAIAEPVHELQSIAAIEEVELAPAPLVPAGAEVRPSGLAAARMGAPDDLTLIDGVSPLQQRTLNSLGVYHFDQIAAWTPGNIAWVDQYLRLRGRIVEEAWVEQADDLAREGPAAIKAQHEAELA